jgi:hypothetical protein
MFPHPQLPIQIKCNFFRLNFVLQTHTNTTLNETEKTTTTTTTNNTPRRKKKTHTAKH